MKRILLILSTILLTASFSPAQESRNPVPEGGKLIKFYPNPATSYITFDLQKSYEKGLTISIYSFLGKKMSETQNVNEKTTIQVSDFNRGVYIYYLTNQSGKVIDTGKFQVSR